MANYLVLLTDRSWNSKWHPHGQAGSINKGDTITIDGQKWDVLNEWIDLDDVHLVFCVKHPKGDQKLPRGVAPTTVPWSGTTDKEPRFTRDT